MITSIRVRRTVAPQDGILLGYSPRGTKTIGFQAKVTGKASPSDPIHYTGPHLLTCAPTGAGKGRNCAIPTLLTYGGSITCVDVKGELATVTARRRREMGQQVVVLDPFQVLSDKTDALNPLDVLDLPGADVDTDCQTLASLLSTGKRFTRDPFWDTVAGGLNAGCLEYIATQEPAEKRTLSRLRDLLYADDTVYNLAVILDTCGKKMPRLAYQEIASFLQQPERETRPSTLATAQSYLKTINSDRVAQALGPSTMSLTDFADGKPMTIYIVIPPDRLDSHAALLTLWLGTLFRAIFSRRRAPAQRTLMLIDEAAHLGSFPYLQTAVTLCRSYGVRCWSFWQDVQQLQNSFPQSWKTIVNNCGALQVFGLTNLQMAHDWAEILNCRAEDLLALGDDEQFLRLGRQIFPKALRADYLRDRHYQGQYDENSFYGR